MIPTVAAIPLSDTGQEEITSTARSNENRVLEALVSHERASLAELATSLGWFMRSGQPHKMMVKRILDKLQKYKLVTLERDGPVLTDKGEKTLKALKFPRAHYGGAAQSRRANQRQSNNRRDYGGSENRDYGGSEHRDYGRGPGTSQRRSQQSAYDPDYARYKLRKFFDENWTATELK
jgi:hypothetical protein